MDRGPELLLLHALPLDRSMWTGQMGLLPGATQAPNLYTLGGDLPAWAASALATMRGDRIVVAGCSVGGSCALEVARLAPERVAALVLIGTKAEHRPDPELHAAALAMLDDGRVDAAWQTFWQPLFSTATPAHVVESARRCALAQPPSDLARGVTAFHTRDSRTDVLAGFGGPIAIVTGAEDTAPGLATSERQTRMARDGSLHVIPDCGHYVPLERPGEINAILRDVIASIAR
ncbi:alpha/beta fold hydrolase [Mesorhizobium australicum]|uniref:Pimeloyl-ACP methyl ester carboxylesterase n=1 Tax=Mesorhizobium australicum TaxID=536018 RepID=A0A1X7PIG8_9HYPH|nr:alpha/beta hydrolase [Mesorhizobium australicum]SMH51151.1 Pimeloyl-ACP methyl ester carboxylesterase [Mesorhizobium australicum]